VATSVLLQDFQFRSKSDNSLCLLPSKSTSILAPCSTSSFDGKYKPTPGTVFIEKYNIEEPEKRQYQLKDYPEMCLDRDSCFWSTSALQYGPCTHCGTLRWSLNYYPGTSLAEDKGRNCVFLNREKNELEIRHCELGYYEFEKFSLDKSILDILIHEVSYTIPDNFAAQLEVKSAASQSCENYDPSMNRDCRFVMSVTVQNTQDFNIINSNLETQGATLRFDIQVPFVTPSLTVDMRKQTFSQTSLTETKVEEVTFSQTAKVVAYPQCRQEANVKVHWGRIDLPFVGKATITYRSGKIETTTINGSYKAVLAAKSVIDYSANQPLIEGVTCTPKKATIIPKLETILNGDDGQTSVALQ